VLTGVLLVAGIVLVVRANARSRARSA
jgi:hypothetical protein